MGLGNLFGNGWARLSPGSCRKDQHPKTRKRIGVKRPFAMWVLLSEEMNVVWDSGGSKTSASVRIRLLKTQQTSDG
jgi:hypothetical protein